MASPTRRCWRCCQVTARDTGDLVELCRELRLLGATEVSLDGFHAKFAGVARAAPPEPAEPVPDKPALSEAEARELEYARELGRA
jgi:hypothetical protein